jgi:hypothetical protein
LPDPIIANGRTHRNNKNFMGLTDIKKELKKLDKDKLIDLIADLYKKNI